MRSSGQGKVGCILWLLVAGAAVLFAWRVVPIKIATAEFESFVEEQAKFSARANAEQVKSRIVARAKEMDLPVDPKNIEVRKGRDRIRVQVRYTIPIDLVVTTWNWEIEHLVDRPIFIF